MRPPAVLDGLGVETVKLDLHAPDPVHLLQHRDGWPDRTQHPLFQWRQRGAPNGNGRQGSAEGQRRAPAADGVEIRHADHLVLDIGTPQGGPILIHAAHLEGNDAPETLLNQDLAIQVDKGDPEIGGCNLQQLNLILRDLPQPVVAPVAVLENATLRPGKDLQKHRPVGDLRHLQKRRGPQVPRSAGQVGEIRQGDLNGVTLQEIGNLIGPMAIRRGAMRAGNSRTAGHRLQPPRKNVDTAQVGHAGGIRRSETLRDQTHIQGLAQVGGTVAVLPRAPALAGVVEVPEPVDAGGDLKVVVAVILVALLIILTPVMTVLSMVLVLLVLAVQADGVEAEGAAARAPVMAVLGVVGDELRALVGIAPEGNGLRQEEERQNQEEENRPPENSHDLTSKSASTTTRWRSSRNSTR